MSYQKDCNLILLSLMGGGLDTRYFSNLSFRAVVYFEGYRLKQRQLLEKVCKDRKYIYANFFSIKCRLKNMPSNYWIYQFEPTLIEQVLFTAANVWSRLGDFLKSRIVKKR